MTSLATVVGRRSPWAHLAGVSQDSCLAYYDLVEQRASRLGYGVEREPAIPTPARIHKPDLILDRGECVTILDVTIVKGNSDLEECHEKKCLYYDQPAIRQWVQQCYQPRSISFEAVAMNWRGLLAVRTAAALRALGLSALFLSLISLVTLECGMWIVNHFRHSTFTIRDR